ncbi:GntR family transcriptional regulator [Paenibacillus silvisoli]|uniref:GntR family transcriptional regulator n=1 Tax=Paenibacillus silvisoli TaxID=3110539 RepID=UPI002806355D|nr:GntR family transcriptional regulator [Paenibacillus silvisoli]
MKVPEEQERPSRQRPLSKLVVANVWDQTYQVLKERILARHFGANEKLLIPELAEQLGVSRTPIRDALNRLEAEGLVRTVSKVGTFVNPVLEDNVNDIMDSRLMIDCWTIDRLQAMEEKQLAARFGALETIVEKASDSFASRSLSEIDLELQSDLDLKFHLELVRMSGNLKNVDTYKSLMNYRYLNLGAPHVTPDMAKLAFRQHLAIYDALRARNFAVAKTAVTAHLAFSKQNILNVIIESGGEI